MCYDKWQNVSILCQRFNSITSLSVDSYEYMNSKLICISFKFIVFIWSYKLFYFWYFFHLIDTYRLLTRNSRTKRKSFHLKWNPLLFGSHFMVQGSHHVFGEKCNSFLRNKINDDHLVKILYKINFSENAKMNPKKIWIRLNIPWSDGRNRILH